MTRPAIAIDRQANGLFQGALPQLVAVSAYAFGQADLLGGCTRRSGGNQSAALSG